MEKEMDDIYAEFEESADRSSRESVAMVFAPLVEAQKAVEDAEERLEVANKALDEAKKKAAVSIIALCEGRCYYRWVVVGEYGFAMTPGHECEMKIMRAWSV